MWFTQAGYDDLKVRQATLLKKREEVVVRLAAAREQGDLSENGAYKAARAELGDTDRELRRLEYLLKSGKPMAPRTDGKAGIGNRVTLAKPDGKEVTYLLVGTHEADALKGKVSAESPMGAAMIGKEAGDSFEVNGITFRIANVA